MADKPVRISTLRKRVLDQQRLESVRDPGKQARLEKVDERKDYKKTPLMIALELAHSKPIEELIAKGSIYQVAKRLGIHPTTVYLWRKRLEMG